MALHSEFLTVYAIRCDGCYQLARHAFHRIVAIAYAKKAGYQRLEIQTVSGKVSEIVWVCKRCAKNETFMKSIQAHTKK